MICQYNFLNLYWGEEKSLKKKKKKNPPLLVLEEKFGMKAKLVRRRVDVTRATGMSLK